MHPYTIKLNYSTTSTLNTPNSPTALQDGRLILERAEDNNPGMQIHIRLWRQELCKGDCKSACH